MSITHNYQSLLDFGFSHYSATPTEVTHVLSDLYQDGFISYYRSLDLTLPEDLFHQRQNFFSHLVTDHNDEPDYIQLLLKANIDYKHAVWTKDQTAHGAITPTFRKNLSWRNETYNYFPDKHPSLYFMIYREIRNSFVNLFIPE